MALVESPVIVASVSLIDAQNRQATVEVAFPNTVLLSLAVAKMNTVILPAIAGLTNASVAGWSISHSAQDASVTALTASEDSNVKEKLVFACKAANGQDVRVSVPSPVGAAIQQGSDLANESHAGVVAMKNLLVDTGLFDTTGATSNIGSPIASVRSVRFGTRK